MTSDFSKVDRMWGLCLRIFNLREDEVQPLPQAFCQHLFWRTREQQEIDYLEVGSGAIHAYEFKWNPATKPKFSKTFTRAYPEAELALVNSENYSTYLN